MAALFTISGHKITTNKLLQRIHSRVTFLAQHRALSCLVPRTSIKDVLRSRVIGANLVDTSGLLPQTREASTQKDATA